MYLQSIIKYGRQPGQVELDHKVVGSNLVSIKILDRNESKAIGGNVRPAGHIRPAKTKFLALY